MISDIVFPQPAASLRERIDYRIYALLPHVRKVRQTQNPRAEVFGNGQRLAGAIREGRLDMAAFAPPSPGFNAGSQQVV